MVSNPTRNPTIERLHVKTQVKIQPLNSPQSGFSLRKAVLLNLARPRKKVL